MAKIDAYLTQKLRVLNDPVPLLTYDRINCSMPGRVDTDGGTQRQFNPKSIPKLKRALASGKYHGIIIVDWTHMEKEFMTHLGRLPILSQFCNAGGIIAFPLSRATVIPHFSEIFQNDDTLVWKPSDYLPSPKAKWVPCHEEENGGGIANSLGGHDQVRLLPGIPPLPTSFTTQSTCLQNVPPHEQMYQLEQSITTPTIGGRANDTSARTAVAVHHHGAGRVLFMGDTKWELLLRFLLYSSPLRPIDISAQLDDSTLDKVQDWKLKGNMAFGQKDYSTAVKAYHEAIGLFEKRAGTYPLQQHIHVTLHSNLAECYLRQYDYEACIETITKGLVYTKFWACHDYDSVGRQGDCSSSSSSSSHDDKESLLLQQEQEATIVIKATIRRVKARIALVGQEVAPHEPQPGTVLCNPVQILEEAHDELERVLTTRGGTRTKRKSLIHDWASVQEKKALQDMAQRVQQWLVKVTKKQKDQFRMNFAAALTTTTDYSSTSQTTGYAMDDEEESTDWT
jgi:hypothetical protein